MSQGTQGVCSPLPRGSGHQGDYTMGFLGTTGGTSWALSSWVWAHREFTFTASQLEFTKCCRKGPKPGTKDRLVCSGQAWAEVSVSALLPHLLGDLLWLLGPSRTSGGSTHPFPVEACNLTNLGAFPKSSYVRCCGGAQEECGADPPLSRRAPEVCAHMSS